MDKNPDQALADSLRHYIEESRSRGPHIILASKPFHKAELVSSLLDMRSCPAIVLDFDLLYSGYVASGMIQKKDDVEIFCPYKDEWNATLRIVLERISLKRHMVIIDSFNGLHGMHDGRDSARLVNASLMLLAYAGGFHKCPVIVMALTRRNKKLEHVLSPGGRRIMHYKGQCLYMAGKTDGMLHLTVLHQAGQT